jgi:SpoIIAA-like
VSPPTGGDSDQKLDESSDNVLGWEVTGKVTEEEVRTLSEEFKAAIAEHGTVRVLVRMRRIPRMGLGAWAEDVKLTPYAKDVERYAIVTHCDYGVVEVLHPHPVTSGRANPSCPSAFLSGDRSPVLAGLAGGLLGGLLGLLGEDALWLP